VGLGRPQNTIYIGHAHLYHHVCITGTSLGLQVSKESLSYISTYLSHQVLHLYKYLQHKMKPTIFAFLFAALVGAMPMISGRTPFELNHLVISKTMYIGHSESRSQPVPRDGTTEFDPDTAF
jgi:hypothetical protein